MGVDDIEQHLDPHRVRRINEPLERLWRAKPARYSKKARHLIAKTGIVGVFHDGHQLNAVVAKGLDAGEKCVGKVIKGGNLLLRGANTD